MRKIFLFIFLTNICFNASSQVINGSVKDKYSGTVISFASIYFNGTFVGTNSDQNGCFELDVSNRLTMPLTISALGYYSETLTQFSADTALLVFLTPKVFELNEVVISAKAGSRKRKTYLELFRNEFLGTTLNAMRCKIINEKDIALIYDNGTLKAFASKPIQIDNKALGYKIIYFLDKFESCKETGSLLFIGNIIFKEDLTLKNSQKERFEKRRRTAYLGSRMHFFRELWNNNIESAGFTIKGSTNSKLEYNKLVISTDSIITGVYIKYLKYQGNLNISYYTKAPESNIMMNKDYVSFDKNGYFDPLGISWNGEMAKQRIADLLPYEYSVKKPHR